MASRKTNNQQRKRPECHTPDLTITLEWQSLTIGQAIMVLENEPDLQQHFGLDFSLGRQYQKNLQ